jgi:hypothetical protein
MAVDGCGVPCFSVFLVDAQELGSVLLLTLVVLQLNHLAIYSSVKKKTLEKQHQVLFSTQSFC